MIEAYPGAMYRHDYGIHRWWDGPVWQSLHGAYFLVVRNIELFILQGNINPHVICIVDDFGDLVRKPS